jgi:crossover junction endodeoxyribonuclease RuvC
LLRLAEAPKPADAADALALAITHAWRGSPASGASAKTLTPAQSAWKAAEQSARRS